VLMAGLYVGNAPDDDETLAELLAPRFKSALDWTDWAAIPTGWICRISARLGTGLGIRGWKGFLRRDNFTPTGGWLKAISRSPKSRATYLRGKQLAARCATRIGGNAGEGAPA